MNIRVIFIVLLLNSFSVWSDNCGQIQASQSFLKHQVEAYCGRPFWVDSQVELQQQSLGSALFLQKDVVLDQWYFNLGPDRLMRRMSFRNGVLVHVETLNYGLSPSEIGRSCKARLLVVGLSAGEIYLRCGEPLWMERRQSGFRLANPSHRVGLASVDYQTWVYAFGRGKLERILSFENGVLVKIDRGRRH